MSKINKTAADDWRRQGQERFLSGVKLFAREFQPDRLGRDHDHCEFCGGKFSIQEGDLKKGYSTEDGYHWVCTKCLNDFKDEFKWDVEGEN